MQEAVLVERLRDIRCSVQRCEVGVMQAFQPYYITEKFAWSLVRVWWRILVTNLATNFQDLVANVDQKFRHIGDCIRRNLVPCVQCVELTLVSLQAGSLSVLFTRVSWWRKSVNEASRREEWGEEKWACTKAVEFWILPLWGDKSLTVKVSNIQPINKRSKI